MYVASVEAFPVLGYFLRSSSLRCRLCLLKTSLWPSGRMSDRTAEPVRETPEYFLVPVEAGSPRHSCSQVQFLVSSVLVPCSQPPCSACAHRFSSVNKEKNPLVSLSLLLMKATHIPPLERHLIFLNSLSIPSPTFNMSM